MAQIFPRSANTIAKASIVLVAFGVAGSLALLYALDKSPFHTKQGTFTGQEVPFSHDHHIEGLGLDCRYCHTSVEDSSFAGIPPSQTCMNCHKIIWNETEMLKPVRDSYANNEPLQWNRVYDLPDYVYFNHSVHVKKGIGCQSCHGQVNEMPLVYQEHSLQMSWCLDCHRAPEDHVRPRSEIVSMDYEPEGSQAEVGARLVAEYDIKTLENCSVCHR